MVKGQPIILMALDSLAIQVSFTLYYNMGAFQPSTNSIDVLLSHQRFSYLFLATFMVSKNAHVFFYISVGMSPGRSLSITFQGSPESAVASHYGFISLHHRKNTPASHVRVSSSGFSRHVTSLSCSLHCHTHALACSTIE